jgi:hypothetical protein
MDGNRPHIYGKRIAERDTPLISFPPARADLGSELQHRVNVLPGSRRNPISTSVSSVSGSRINPSATRPSSADPAVRANKKHGARPSSAPRKRLSVERSESAQPIEATVVPRHDPRMTTAYVDETATQRLILKRTIDSAAWLRADKAKVRACGLLMY